jgi:hypothetical protein
MNKKPDEPLRGEARYTAEKRAIAERNEAAFKRGRAERTARDAAADDRRRAAERRESDQLPVQPTP